MVFCMFTRPGSWFQILARCNNLWRIAYKAAVRWGFQGIPLGLGQNHDEPLVFGAILARTHTHTHTQTWWFPIFRGTPSHHLF